jgi:hypothetical protein
MLELFQSVFITYKDWVPLVVSFAFTVFFDGVWSKLTLFFIGKPAERRISFSALMLSGVIAGLVTFFVLIIVAAIQYKHALVSADFCQYIGEYITQNVSVWVKFSIPLVINLILGSLYSEIKEKRRGGEAIGIVSGIVAAVLLVLYATVPVKPALIIPANILATSYNTIPVDYLLIEERTYFTDGTYLVPQPFEIPISSPPSGPIAIDDQSAATPTLPLEWPPDATSPQPEPSTFSELMYEVRNLSEMSEKWLSYLDKAYAIYQSGSVDADSNAWDIAWMFVCLADSNYNGDADVFYLEAAERFVTSSPWNAGYCYGKLDDYENAEKYYRLAYRSTDLYEDEFDRYVLLGYTVDYVKSSSGIDKAISEYGTAQQYFSKKEVKLDIYFDSGNLYLEKYAGSSDMKDFNKAISEYEKGRKITGYTYVEELKIVDKILETYERHSDVESAIVYLRSELNRRIITANPEATAHIYLELIERDNEAEPILLEAKEVLSKSQYFADFANKLGNIYAGKKDYDAAKYEFMSVYASELPVSENQKTSALTNMIKMIENAYFAGDYVDVAELVPQIPLSLETSLLYCQAALKINTIQDDMQTVLNRIIERYPYHPKVMIYCSALGLIARDINLTNITMNHLGNLYNKEKYHNEDPYYDVFDIVNYTKLLQVNGLYKHAHEIVSSLGADTSEAVVAHAALVEASSLYFERNLTSSRIRQREANIIVKKLLAATQYFSAHNVQNSHNAVILLNLLYGNVIGDEFDYSILEALIPKENINNNYLLALTSWKIDNDFTDALRYCDAAVAKENANFQGFSKYDILMLRAEIYYEYALTFEQMDERRDQLQNSQHDYEQILSEIGILYEQASIGLSQTREALAQVLEPDLPVL